MLVNDHDYLVIVAEVKQRIAIARQRALQAVNSELVSLYWGIGRLIGEHNQWGRKFIENLSRDIRSEYPGIKGFSVRNLAYMLKFAQVFPTAEILQTVSAELTWSHHVVLLDKVEDPVARSWYAEQAAADGWSVRTLEDQVQRRAYQRQALPDKVTNFSERLSRAQAALAQEFVKDPYLFDFISARSGMVEREIESELVRHMTQLLMELGSGFAFVGHQYHLEIEGEDFYIDLLFYHLRLRCYVVIELKTGAFKPEYAGQINFYIAAVDRMLSKNQDNPTIGLILCRDKRGLIAEWALSDIMKPVGVSEYQLFDVLPDELQDLLPSARDIESRIGAIFPDADETDERYGGKSYS